MTQSPQQFTLIRAGRLFDGKGEQAVEGIAILVRGDTIEAVGPQAEVGFPAGADGELLDMPEATVLPGLIDCHTHTNMPGDGRRGEDVNAHDDDQIRLLRAAHNVRTALETGVTTVCDCGGWNETVFRLKAGIKEGLVDGPRVVASGRPITITGGHCWFMGSEADGVDGVRQAARLLIKQGADFLKVMATGGSTLGTDPFRPAFSAEELSAIVEEGHRRDRRVVAHCRTNLAMHMVLDAGFDAIMHGWFTDETGTKVFDEVLAHRIAEERVWVNPTLHITRSRIPLLQAKAEAGTATPDEVAMLGRMPGIFAQNISHAAKLVGAGVRFMAGSDCGWGVYPFGRFDLELQAMVEGGLTHAQALLAATSGNAEALGIGDRVGTVAKGMEADLIVVVGAPDKDVSAIADVAAVFKSGRRIR
jgi:imidazolonepropionase-like amidohydrolase